MKTPNAWKRANIMPIPKSIDWNKDIDKTRPHHPIGNDSENIHQNPNRQN